MYPYAVFGNPVLHSKSPQLFGPLLEAGKEHYARIRAQSAEDLVRIVRLLDIKGASITSPFKETILPLLDNITLEARHVRAANCLRQRNGLIEGHNSDHYGVCRALEESGLSLKGSRILVLGAGGAARAAVYGLVRAGAKLSISNRTLSRAKELASVFGAGVIPWTHSRPLPRFDAVVSALLPEGIPPYIDTLRYDILLDALYKPSAMSTHTRERGIPLIGGERWLIHQGVEAAAFYIGKKALPEILASGLHQRLQKKTLSIFVLKDDNIPGFHQQTHDLVISAFGLEEDAINHQIHEEKDLAFGG